jgi:signal transduction histidine kinase
MSEETRQRAFEPFFSTKTSKTDARFPATLATGVGLTHVKNMMEPLGVEIELDSKEGKGTTATLRIPYQKVAELYKR